MVLFPSTILNPKSRRWLSISASPKTRYDAPLRPRLETGRCYSVLYPNPKLCSTPNHGSIMRLSNLSEPSNKLALNSLFKLELNCNANNINIIITITTATVLEKHINNCHQYILLLFMRRDYAAVLYSPKIYYKKTALNKRLNKRLYRVSHSPFTLLVTLP